MKNLILLTALCNLLFIFSGCKKVITKPNVLFIAVDDLRPSLGCYGDSISISPNIDKLAANGILFNRAYCQQAVCNPSRASVLTGLRPNQIGVTNLHNHFRDKLPDVVTLPQLFKMNGYESVAIGKIYHGSEITQDEISWTKPTRYNLSDKADEYALLVNKTGNKEAAYECANLQDSCYEDGMITDLAIDKLQELKDSGQPFFLAVGFKKPHLPFSAPKKYWDLYNPTLFQNIPDQEKPVNAPNIAFHNSQELRGYRDIPLTDAIDQQKEIKLWNGYYACVSFVDSQIGKLITSLKQLELDNNTIIVLWGDHGYHLGEQELWCKSTNFELDNRIPLIFSSQNHELIPGMKSEAIVEAVDIYPTIIDLCGLQAQGILSGKSLKPAFTDSSASIKDYAFSQFVRPYGALNKKLHTHTGYSVRNTEWRCTVWFNIKNDSIEFKELYNYRESNIENENLSGNEKYAEVEMNLIQMIQNYRKL